MPSGICGTRLFPASDIIQDKLYGIVDPKHAAVYAQIVAGCHPPLFLRLEIVVAGTLLICLCEHILCLRVSDVILCRHAAGTELSIRMYKDADKLRAVPELSLIHI